jgi:hypothetical protein
MDREATTPIMRCHQEQMCGTEWHITGVLLPAHLELESANGAVNQLGLLGGSLAQTPNPPADVHGRALIAKAGATTAALPHVLGPMKAEEHHQEREAQQLDVRRAYPALVAAAAAARSHGPRLGKAFVSSVVHQSWAMHGLKCRLVRGLSLCGTHGALPS